MGASFVKYIEENIVVYVVVFFVYYSNSSKLYTTCIKHFFLVSF